MGINLINSINYGPRKARVVDTVDRVESHWICEVYAPPIKTDRHGHPPKGVSSCPVGKQAWGECLRRCNLARSLINSNALGGATDDQTDLS